MFSNPLCQVSHIPYLLQAVHRLSFSAEFFRMLFREISSEGSERFKVRLLLFLMIVTCSLLELKLVYNIFIKLLVKIIVFHRTSIGTYMQNVYGGISIY